MQRISRKQTPIARARRAAGLTQKELGDVLGFTRQTIYYWDCGKLSKKRTSFMLKVIEALAKYE